MSDAARWLADRTRSIEMSGVRRVFELARSLKDPINLSIGQPHFPVPEPIREAAVAAIRAGQNGYTVTQGVPELRLKIKDDLDRRLGHSDREVLVTSGTSGALTLAMLAVVNPGDEVIFFDPYFVAYPHLVTLAGGTPVVIDTYPDFIPDPDAVAAAVTPRTKAILLGTPANPSGAVLPESVLRAIAGIAARHGILLISDEIYHAFGYDTRFISPASFHPDTLVVDGFGKTYGFTGWRMGYAHGPRPLIEEMTKLQQFTYVCAPTPAQYAAAVAWDLDMQSILDDYRRKRDHLRAALAGKYELGAPGGAFYLFPKAPWGTGSEFVSEAIRNNLLIIPGSAFSRRDSHFRVSYAASDESLARGIEVLLRLAERG
jgi:aspartate aminotransferase/aminotransferase